MKVFEVRYRKDEWVTVNISFADDVNIDDLEHEQLAISAATCEKLTQYETWIDSLVSVSSVEVDEVSNRIPDVVITADGSVFSTTDYESRLTVKSAN